MVTKARAPYTITGNKVIVDYGAMYCDSPEQLIQSPLFAEIVERFLLKLAGKGSPLFSFARAAMPGLKTREMAGKFVALFKLLASHTADEIIGLGGEYGGLLANRERLYEFIAELYNFWRGHERVIYHISPSRAHYARSSLHHAQFITANEKFRNLVLSVRRKIGENLTGKNPAVYRQLPAGANMGVLVENIEWDCPYELSHLKEIPFILLSLIEPPLMLYSKSNTRKGKYAEIPRLTEDLTALSPAEWFCFPAKVGELTAFLYFHQDFITLGLSMSNLFEIATYEEIEGKKPDLLMLFGVQHGELPEAAVFHEDKDSGILIGLVRHCDAVDYFGYFKKTALTLHNVAMLQRGRMPVHGAMVSVKLKEGGSANVVLMGDSGAGKSETLEALRSLAEDHICEMTVVFDDMGSLGMKEGRVAGYGTETGAFVRLDDLSPEYAYKEFDRAIFMNPSMVNSRLVIPITPYPRIIHGYPVDIMLYANNYDSVDDDRPAIELYDGVEQALAVFRKGARMAKGTTDEKGLVRTYFANPFGAPQRKEAHEKIAREYFNAMFATGVKVGQMRTRLGIEGFEREGPRAASMALFELIRSLAEGKEIENCG